MVKGDTPAQDRIDKKQFENLCGLQCTLEEVCDFFDVNDKTLNSWCKSNYGTTFYEVFKVKRSRGQLSLRRTQWKLAEKNPSMAIFLGKQYLKQKDNVEEEKKEKEKQLIYIPAKDIGKAFVDLYRDIEDRKHYEYWIEGGRGSVK